MGVRLKIREVINKDLKLLVLSPSSVVMLSILSCNLIAHWLEALASGGEKGGIFRPPPPYFLF